MSQAFWQAKIWGLLHDPMLKALHDNRGRGKEGLWESLSCMRGWVSPQDKSKTTAQFSRKWLNHVGLCDFISSASDRAAIGRLPQPAVDYTPEGLQIRHLLSGKPQTLRLSQWHDYLMELGKERVNWLTQVERSLIPDAIKQETDSRKVFWWLWRCYPQVLSQAFDRDSTIPNEPKLALLPAETRIPDGSLWSHATMTSALAGALAGYYADGTAYPQKYARNWHKSHPHVASFTFTPVQELIKASRKMRDFWAGSWLLHYLSARVCWHIARKYGPDTFLYPCLYAQPLIDLWLLQEYPEFREWIEMPDSRRLLTAGFPNVLVMILPDNGAAEKGEKNPVTAAMQQAQQSLLQEWLGLGELVLESLQGGTTPWMPNLNRQTWQGWLRSQWQTYWVGLPIGDRESSLHQSPRRKQGYQEWEERQNKFARPLDKLLVKPEKAFLQATYEFVLKQNRKNPPNLNVGSWWASIFDQTRLSLNGVKNVRTWTIPTAFGPRSTISGMGPVVHPICNSEKPDWVTEGDTAAVWSEENHQGLFDGIEMLNATEVLKRGLHRILPGLLDGTNGLTTNPDGTKVLTTNPDGTEVLTTNPDGTNGLTTNNSFEWYYPDLTSGVVGWLRQMEREGNDGAIAYYQDVCERVYNEFVSKWASNFQTHQPWGIPWVKTYHSDWFHPRLLNLGWLIEEFHPQTTDAKAEIQEKVSGYIAQYFRPGNNPTDWYVLAAGDGDGMGDWLKGIHLKEYQDYIPDVLQNQLPNLPEELREPFQQFIQIKKRMGPATHSALSRALLDFSNQLVPYLTEERYAGRLIYGGGDDVLAYTNLWEWDSWLWDIRQCFRGQDDPRGEFESEGDYWFWDQGNRPKRIAERPLFTMGETATISFGVVIAHHSVPLAIALENLWEAEAAAKDHQYHNGCQLMDKKPGWAKKDALQVRVLYGNGNRLKATAKFDGFSQWQPLLQLTNKFQLDSALFEQAAQVYAQHPVPVPEALAAWTRAFCSRREALAESEVQGEFQRGLLDFLHGLWLTNLQVGGNNHKWENQRDLAVQNWLKLAAFLRRNRMIRCLKLG